MVGVLDADRRLHRGDAVLARLDRAAVAHGGLGDPRGADLRVDVALRGGVVGVHEGVPRLALRLEQRVVAEADLHAGAVAGAGLLAAVVEPADAGDVAAELDAPAGVDAAVGMDLAGEGHRRAGMHLQVALVERRVVAERRPLHHEDLAQDAAHAGLGVARAADDLDLLASGREGAGGGEVAERDDGEAQLVAGLRRLGRLDQGVAHPERGDAARVEQPPHAHHAVAEAGLRGDERAAHHEVPLRQSHRPDRVPRERGDGEAERDQQQEDDREDRAPATARRGAAGRFRKGAVRRDVHGRGFSGDSTGNPAKSPIRSIRRIRLHFPGASV